MVMLGFCLSYAPRWAVRGQFKADKRFQIPVVFL
jgi:hypothetical protein